ncbi:MAG: hypothetical protein HY784_09405, partial [Chloroflexi bacterium]|nr:hypothetical protein [Chloroflexota bacterium]
MAARQAAEARDAARLALERARQQAEIRREQLADVDKQAHALEAEQATPGTQDQQLPDTCSLARAQLAAAELALGQLGGEEFAEQAAEWATGVAVAARAATDSQSRLDDLRRARDSADSQLAERRDRMARLADELAQLAASGGGRRQRERALGAEIEALGARIQPAEVALQAEETQNQQAEAEADAARAATQAAERRHAQAQLEFSRKQDALEHLRRQIEDDFGLVEFDYAADVTGPTPLPLGEAVEKLQTVEALPEG